MGEWVGLKTMVTAMWVLLASSPTPARANVPPLNPEQRERIRFRLENLFNEVDLMIRNRNSDLGDIRRQELTFGVLHVFERIPFAPDWKGLERALARSAKEHGIKLVSFTPEPARSSPPSPPPRIFSDDRNFRLSPEQVAEELPFRMSLRGDELQIRDWIDHLKDEVMRLVELKSGPMLPPALSRLGTGRFEVRAQAWRFRKIKYPALIPHDPLLLLPEPARRSPGEFARREPQLWRFVSRTRTLLPQAKPLYKDRERFLLNSARMDFFVFKSTGVHETDGRSRSRAGGGA